MTSTPWKNALLALGYILLVSSVMRLMERFAPKEDNFLMPVGALSLLTLSAAVMGFLFLKEPLERYFSGDKAGAVELFLKTVGIFALFTVLAFVLIFFVQ